MPTLHNPTGQDIYCTAIEDVVAAGRSVEITDEQAARVNVETGVWRLTSTKAAEPTTAPASRATGKRGGKQAEVSKAPAMEKR